MRILIVLVQGCCFCLSSLPSIDATGRVTGGAWLSEEVEALRRNSSQSSLVALSDVRLLRQTVDPETLESRQVPPNSPIGPWTLDATVQGPKGSKYDHPYRVSIRVGPKYPGGPVPQLRVKGTIHHADIDHKLHDIAPDIVKKMFWNTSSKQFELAHGLQRVPLMLQGELDGKKHRRWYESAKENGERINIIQKYSKLRRYEDLFGDFQESWLDSKFAKALAKIRDVNVSQGKRRGLLRKTMTEEADGVYSFQVFTKAFCQQFIEELEKFYASGLPARRPNSMNNYGVIVNDIGMEHLITSFQERVLQPIIGMLFPAEGSELDGHHSFIVRYKKKEDTHLDVHHDDSDVTFNVCLGRNFTGAGLVLCGRRGAPDHRLHRHTYHHQVGRAILHLGRHRHGADDITDGERFNLIVWNHAYNWRKSRGDDKDPESREKSRPDPECLSYTHDTDYGKFKKYPPDKEHFRGKGWCPPRGLEYIGYGREEL